jgi:hypothetical protein
MALITCEDCGKSISDRAPVAHIAVPLVLRRPPAVEPTSDPATDRGSNSAYQG